MASWRHENKEYFDKISFSVVYSVCSSCYYCIGFDGTCGFRFWAKFLAVLRFWMCFSSVLRFLVYPNAPLLFSFTAIFSPKPSSLAVESNAANSLNKTGNKKRDLFLSINLPLICLPVLLSFRL